MAAYSVRLYLSSGFDRGNVPGDFGCLDNLKYIDKPAVWNRQDRYLSTIKIDATWEELDGVDYCALTGDTKTTFYVVDGIQMLSPKTAQLSLIYDPLLSNGGLDAIQVRGGWTVRAHPGMGDKLFANINAEPWSPTQPLRLIGRKYLNGKIPTGNQPHNLVVCTCNLAKAQDYEAAVAKVSDAAEGGDYDKVIWPKLPTMSGRSPTYVSFEGAIYDLPNQYIFDLGTRSSPNKTLLDNVNALRAMGIESAIVNAYVLPASAFATMSKDDFVGYVTSIAGNNSIISRGSSMLGTDFDYIYIYPENRSSFLFLKTQALYHKYQITSITSGNNIEFSPWDIIDPKDLAQPNPALRAPKFVIFDDPAPGGTSYCRPQYYEGTETERLEQSVAGMPWLTAGLTYEGASGGALTMANAARTQATERANRDYQNQQMDKQRDRGLVSTAIGAIGNIATGNIGGLASGLYNGFNGLIDINDQQRQYNRMEDRRMGDNLFSAQAAAMNTAPALAFPVSANAAAYFGNQFCFTCTGLSVNDAIRLDKFFSAYGYAMDKPLEYNDLINMKRYNYIKTSECTLQDKSASGGRRITMTDLEMIQDMFNAGVRIFHNSSDTRIADWTNNSNPAIH